MTESKKKEKHREFWIDVDYENLVTGEIEGRALSTQELTDMIHTIEYAALEELQKQNEALKFEANAAIVAERELRSQVAMLKEALDKTVSLLTSSETKQIPANRFVEYEDYLELARSAIQKFREGEK